MFLNDQLLLVVNIDSVLGLEHVISPSCVLFM